MNKSGLIILITILSFIGLIFFLPYIEFHQPKHKYSQNNQLIDYLIDSGIEAKLILPILFYPLFLVIESTMWKKKKKLWNRFIFFLQGVFITFLGFYVWFIMAFHLFINNYSYTALFYLILTYLSLGIIWNILLAIPYFDNNRFINGTYNKLSLKKPTKKMQ